MAVVIDHSLNHCSLHSIAIRSKRSVSSARINRRARAAETTPVLDERLADFASTQGCARKEWLRQNY